jgi:hypothetical protein
MRLKKWLFAMMCFYKMQVVHIFTTGLSRVNLKEVHQELSATGPSMCFTHFPYNL